MLKKSVSAILTIVIVILAVIWVLDYNKVRQGFKPMFCLKEETYTYDDGQIKKCVGVGYNVFSYERKSNEAVKFSPFWIGMEE